MKKIYILFLLSLTNLSILFSQPINDVCSGAQTLPQNGTCIGGTTAGADDHWIGGVGCQAASGGNEVWYTFTSIGTTANFVITNGTQTGNIELVIVEASGPCAGFGYRGSSCGTSPMNVTFQGFVPGALYYITVNGTGVDGTFTICNTVTTPPPTPGQDCPNAAPLCDGSPFSQGVFTGIGVAEDIRTNSCFGGNERQAKWYTFTVSQSGTFEWLIDPNLNTDDYDWAIWNTTSGCYTSGVRLGAPIACNWSGCPGNTGITSANPCTVINYDCTGNPNDCVTSQINTSPPTLVAGQTYTILIDNFTGSGNGFANSFGGTAVIGPDATFAAVLSANCMSVTVDRLAFYTGPNMTYQWNFGDGTTSTSPIPSPHTYVTTGLYTITLDVTDANGCTQSFSQTVDIGCTILSVEMLDFDGENIQDKYNKLTWITSDEKDNDLFILQRSINGVNWTDIANITGNGTTNEQMNYYFNDYDFNKGVTNYYRLKQVNFGGELGYSQIISINNVNNKLNNLLVYPNPFNNIINIENISDNTQIEIFNTLGQLIYQKRLMFIDNHRVEIKTDNFTFGIYTIIIKTNNYIKTYKLRK